MSTQVPAPLRSVAHVNDINPSEGASRATSLVAGAAVAWDRAGFLAATAPSGQRQVALVSGGGAGHEPLHGGFVGPGGLDAACPGEVFTSPHNRQIYAGSRAVARPGGVLHIVKNYTGDVLNFGIAAERLRREGIAVETVLVDDDLGTDAAAIGRRGTAATLVLEKILGAAADTGLGLGGLAQLGRDVVARTRSVAVAFAAQNSLDTGRAAFDIAEGSLEYGVGIHGERGAQAVDLADAAELVRRMVTELLAALGPTRSPLVVVNGLGGTSNLDVLNLALAADAALREAGVTPESVVAGTFVSALDMRGFSLTVTDADPAWLPHWYAPHGTVGLPTPRPAHAGARVAGGSSDDTHPGEPVSAALCEFAARIESLRPAFNDLDQRAGDGDFGENFAKGTREAVRGGESATATLAGDLATLARAFMDRVGGSSGPLFGLLLERVAAAVAEGEQPARDAARGLREGLEAVKRVGGARVGDRTLVDALEPAVGESGGATELSVDVVERTLAAARGTATLVGKRGRASYLGDRVVGAPDPGALAAAALVLMLLERTVGAEAGLWSDLEAALTGAGQ
ncbi:dihydroxyacetone kinase subunit DhaK [Micrococcales bacterium 31B]|nr:dihydroxyacetone kinase subunit DhaK [Micrococcales bacterium 31B]